MASCKSPIGQMNRRLTIQSVARASDGQGGFTETWQDVATVWASIDPLKGWERMQAMQLASPVTHKVTMRYRSLTTDQRLIYQGRVFDIKEIINPGERKQFLNLQCVETGTITIAPPDTVSVALLQDGSFYLFQDGSGFEIDETSQIQTPTILLAQDGSVLVFQDGSPCELGTYDPINTTVSLLSQDGATLVFQAGGSITITDGTVGSESVLLTQDATIFLLQDNSNLQLM